MESLIIRAFKLILNYFFFRYALGIASNHQDPTTVYRDLSPTTIHTLRFIMHTLIYAHVSNAANTEQVRRVAQLLRQPPQSVNEFLAQHLRANWDMLRHLLAVNDDSLGALLHLVIAEYLFTRFTPSLIPLSPSSLFPRTSTPNVEYVTQSPQSSRVFCVVLASKLGDMCKGFPL
jgi:hypothetical protein